MGNQALVGLEGGGSLEAHHRAGRNGHGLAGAGVAAGAGGALLGFERAETDELHLLRGHCLGDGGDRGVQSLGGAFLGCIRAEFLLNGINKLSLIHNL